MAKKPTHILPPDLRFAKEVADALTVALEEARYWEAQAVARKQAIDWQVWEEDIYERAKQFLDKSNE